MSESHIKVTSSASTRNSKRLIFDRRYGWVFDEGKDPAEEALAGGRQMFCIVPVSKAFFCMASQWINLVGSSTVEVIKRPELLSPQILQSKFNDQLQRCISSMRKPEFNLFPLKTWEPIASVSHPDPKTSESQTGLIFSMECEDEYKLLARSIMVRLFLWFPNIIPRAVWKQVCALCGISKWRHRDVVKVLYHTWGIFPGSI